jgi:hypothetical protein
MQPLHLIYCQGRIYKTYHGFEFAPVSSILTKKLASVYSIVVKRQGRNLLYLATHVELALVSRSHLYLAWQLSEIT